jgi:hypothetical protein
MAFPRATLSFGPVDPTMKSRLFDDNRGWNTHGEHRKH